MKLGRLGIRGLFRISIIIVAVLAYLALASISYTNVTSGEKANADASIRSEVDYLCLQLESLGNRVDAFARVAESSGTAPQELERKDPDGYRLLSDPVGDILAGYTLAETGTVDIIAGDVVVASDDARVPVGCDVRETLGDEVRSAIGESLEDGQLKLVP